MCADAWNPEQYDRFQRERRQPFDDLLAGVQRRPVVHAVDLGCGTGELTAEMHAALGCVHTLGVDSSAAMLAKAPAGIQGLDFRQSTIEDFAPERTFDLVFSNAALQWIENHDALVPRVAAMVAPGGQLAVQVPANHDHPSHVLAAQLAATEPFCTMLDGFVRQSPVVAPEYYATLLHRCGFAWQRVCLNVYAHLLLDREAVVEWVKGTMLTDYQKRLSPADFALFLDEYRRLLIPALEDAQPYFYPFKRILLWAGR